MSEQDTPQTVSPEEDARIGATPATFANKLYITMMAGGAKITFAEAQRVAGKDEVWPARGGIPATRRPRRPAPAARRRGQRRPCRA